MCSKHLWVEEKFLTAENKLRQAMVRRRLDGNDISSNQSEVFLDSIMVWIVEDCDSKQVNAEIQTIDIAFAQG